MNKKNGSLSFYPLHYIYLVALIWEDNNTCNKKPKSIIKGN